MKIALVTDGIFPYVIGGMQKHSYYVAKYLAKNGVYVDLYHTWQNKEYDINKLEFFTEDEKKYIRHFVIEFPSLGKLPGHYLRESYEYSIRVFNALKSNLDDVDFIYIKGFAGWKLIEEKTKGLKLPPVGIKFHGLNMFQRLPNLKARMEAFMLRPPVLYNMKNADYVFSYGGKITDITRKIGVEEKKIIEIPTGIDPIWLKQPGEGNDGIRRFIYIGRYERLKGVEEMTEALKQLLDRYNFEFHFVGPIPEKVRVKSPNIIYHGTIGDMEKIKALLDTSDCLLCPSYSEGMPNVIIEAMSRGLAIIATDVGAINCLVSAKNGWLLDRCTVSGIKQALIEAITLDSNNLKAKKQESYDITCKNLIWDVIAKKLIASLQQRLTKGITYSHP